MLIHFRSPQLSELLYPTSKFTNNLLSIDNVKCLSKLVQQNQVGRIREIRRRHRDLLRLGKARDEDKSRDHQKSTDQGLKRERTRDCKCLACFCEDSSSRSSH